MRKQLAIQWGVLQIEIRVCSLAIAKLSRHERQGHHELYIGEESEFDSGMDIWMTLTAFCKAPTALSVAVGVPCKK